MNQINKEIQDGYESVVMQYRDEITRLKSAISDKGLDIMWEQLKSREVEIGELECDICDRDAEIVRLKNALTQICDLQPDKLSHDI